MKQTPNTTLQVVATFLALLLVVCLLVSLPDQSLMTRQGVGAIVIDDPLKSSDSKAALTGLESWWGEQASTRRTNRFAQVLIGTRFPRA